MTQVHKVKETGSLRVTMSHMPMYNGKPEIAFNGGPLEIEHWRYGAKHTAPECIKLTDIEEVRDLHYMLGAMLNRLEGKA